MCGPFALLRGALMDGFWLVFFIPLLVSAKIIPIDVWWALQLVVGSANDRVASLQFNRFSFGHVALAANGFHRRTTIPLIFKWIVQFSGQSIKNGRRKSLGTGKRFKLCSTYSEMSPRIHTIRYTQFRSIVYFVQLNQTATSSAKCAAVCANIETANRFKWNNVCVRVWVWACCMHKMCYIRHSTSEAAKRETEATTKKRNDDKFKQNRAYCVHHGIFCRCSFSNIVSLTPFAREIKSQTQAAAPYDPCMQHN